MSGDRAPRGGYGEVELWPHTGTDDCSKCGLRYPSMTWHSTFGGGIGTDPPRGERWPCDRYLGSRFGPGVEHMCRVCETCGYSWVEATAEETAAALSLVPAEPDAS